MDRTKRMASFSHSAVAESCGIYLFLAGNITIFEH